MKKSNVVFLRSNPVQPDPRVEKEANSLLGDGHNVVVVAWDRKSKYKIKESYLELENGRIRVYRFGIPASYGGGVKENLIPLLKFQVRLLHWLVKNMRHYDIIHACDFDTGYVARKCAFFLRKKFVYDIFDYYVDAFKVPNLLKKIIENMEHKIINTSDGVIICTEKRKEQIKGTTPKRLTVIHNSPSKVDVSNTTLELDNSKRIRISYIGILTDGRLLKELAQIIVSNKDLELHIGGFGQYENYFKDLAVEFDNIHFYGRIPYSETLKIENECDIMVALYDPQVPNHYYAGPNKFYEALMLGKPIIMVKSTGMDEIVSNNNIGEIIEYNLDSLSNGIQKLIKRKNEWPEISRNMRFLYEQEFGWSEMEKRLIGLYYSLEKDL